MRLNVLIVEDEFTIAAALVELLQMEGHSTARCSNGEEAWELLRGGGTRFDVIVTDQMMPFMDGVELLALVRKDPALKKIPALLISALPEPRMTPKLWQAYLNKPFDIDVFVKAVHKLGKRPGRKSAGRGRQPH